MTVSLVVLNFASRIVILPFDTLLLYAIILEMVLATVLVTKYLLLRRHHLLCGTNESPIGRLFAEMRRESDIVHLVGIVERL